MCQGSSNPAAPEFSAGFVQLPVAPKSNQAEFSGGECLPCTGTLGGLECSNDGETLVSARLRPGYWRSGLLSARTLRCPKDSFCPGSALVDTNQTERAGNATYAISGHCAALHEGPYCQACARGSYRFWDGSCLACEGSSTWPLLYLVCRAFLACVVLFLLRRQVFRWVARSQWLHLSTGSNIHDPKRQLSIEQRALAAGKTVLVMVQMLLLCLSSMSGVEIPEELGWTTSLLGWLALAFPDQAMALECVSSFSPYYCQLFCVPLLPLLLDFMERVILPQLATEGARGRRRRQLTVMAHALARSTVSWGTWMIIAPVYVKLGSGAFFCHEFEGLPGSYLAMDYSVRCDTSLHYGAQCFAAAVLVAYVIGLPGNIAVRNMRGWWAQRQVIQSARAWAKAHDQHAKPRGRAAARRHGAAQPPPPTTEGWLWSRSRQGESENRWWFRLWQRPPTETRSMTSELGRYNCARIAQGILQRLDPAATADTLRALEIDEDKLRKPLPSGHIILRLLRAGSIGCELLEKTAVGMSNERRRQFLLWQKVQARSVSRVRGSTAKSIWYLVLLHNSEPLTEIEHAWLQALCEQQHASLDCWHCPVYLSQLYLELSTSPRGWVGWTGLGLYDLSRHNVCWREASELLRVALTVMAITAYQAGNSAGLFFAIIFVASRAIGAAFSKPMARQVGYKVQVLSWSVVFALLLLELTIKAKQMDGGRGS